MQSHSTCPGFTDSFAFTAGNTVEAAVLEVSGCRVLRFPGTEVALQGGTLDATTLQLLGLPENYGYG